MLILTAYEDDPYVFALLRAGADGYLLKSADPDDLVRAVKATAAGGKVLDPAVAGRVVAQMTAGKPLADPRPRPSRWSRSANASWMCCAWPARD